MSKILFASPFSPGYRRAAAEELHDLRSLVFTALMVAAAVVISSFFIPVGENLRVYFSFLVTAVCGLVGGPFLALLYGFCADLLGFVLHPAGAFFPGYTLSSMLGALIFALFLYRSRVTVLRLALARLLINALVNVGLGSLWSSILMGKGYYYFLVKSVVKNTLMLPLEVLLLLAVFRFLLPVLSRSDMIGEQPTARIPLI